MKPLQAIAMGMVVVAVDSLGRFDMLPDPIGWLLVIWGVTAMAVPDRSRLLFAAGAACAVAAVLWFPQAKSAIHGSELSLKWAASLPDLLFLYLLSRSLLTAARADTPVDRKFAGRFGLIGWMVIAVAALPPVAYAATSAPLLTAAELGFVVLWIWVIWNMFAASNRKFAQAQARAAT